MKMIWTTNMTDALNWFEAERKKIEDKGDELVISDTIKEMKSDFGLSEEQTDVVLENSSYPNITNI